MVLLSVPLERDKKEGGGEEKRGLSEVELAERSSSWAAKTHLCLHAYRFTPPHVSELGQALRGGKETSGECE